MAKKKVISPYFGKEKEFKKYDKTPLIYCQNEHSLKILLLYFTFRL